MISSFILGFSDQAAHGLSQSAVEIAAPFGLIRYGVAPDHPRIKGIITALHQVLDKPQIRLFGNVDYDREALEAEITANGQTSHGAFGDLQLGRDAGGQFDGPIECRHVLPPSDSLL